ncbi:hypothetical protein [Streptomyces somaliensis]|uniref:Band 7 domain-containing protein n=1 Tax=Streptomyces somaliensis (strain ATCC 33201 / DSM 40738 / JCM 12659 / KCTC 9044 / NCTC 11332 / NRRL B-12077 / IP 733) TaxID=1134445 RepID=A0AA44IDC5_STRE0|nr:hypothetical protein [Streptomyces somaliensis]NKY14496.1 hypothetical protein [Streptomyces somaliensis DSM 40738]
MTPGPAPYEPRDDAERGRPDGGPPGARPRGPLLRECPPPYRRTSGRLAAVLLYRNGGHRVMWPDRKEDHGTPLFGGPYTVFEVLLGRNVTEFDLELPAAGDGVSFRAKASVQWEVDDPHLVVTRQVWDVAELLRDDLLDGLRAVSRRFGITEAQRADEAVRDELAAGRLHFGRDLGLRTRVLVFFDLDSDVKGQLAEADRTLVGMGVDRRVAERERRRDSYDRQLLADRAQELQAVLQQGEVAQIAHHMAANPDKQWEIRRQLLAEEREGKADFLAVLHRLIDTGVIERHDLDQMTYQVLEHLRSSSGGVLGGVADRVLDLPRPRPRALTDGGPPAEPVRPPWEDEPAGPRPADPGDDDPHRVHEPTSVQSARERERGHGRDAGAPGRDAPRRDGDAPPYAPPAPPSADFDDWDDE